MDDVYLAGTGVWIPGLRSVAEAVEAGLYDAEDLASTAMVSVAVSTDTYAPDMAAAAARDAIASSEHTVEEVGILLHAYLFVQGLFAWHAASYVHRLALGTNVPAIEIRQMSNGGLAALSLAIAYIRSNPAPAALITTADRFEEIPEPHTRWNFDDGLIGGDGATALVVSRTGGFAKVRSLSTYSDTSLEGFHRGDAPFYGLEEAAPTSYRRRKREYLARNSFDDTIERFGTGSVSAVDNALRDAKVERSDIDHWILPNMGLHELQTYYLGPLGVALDSTCWSFGRTVGHLGAGDQIAGLHHLRSTGRLQPGDLCAMVGIGSGFSWTCAVLEVSG